MEEFSSPIFDNQSKMGEGRVGASTMRRTNCSTMRRASELRANLTEAEKRLWQAIRRGQIMNVHFRRQHAIGSFIVDFCAPRRRLVIELDGDQHRGQREYDAERTSYLESLGYQVLRFWNGEIMANQEGVLRMIMDKLDPGEG